MKNNLTPIILFAVCALALGPLCAGFFGPEWRARWMLAWAANQFQNKQFDEAEKTLLGAAALSDGLSTDPDFWNLRFDIVLNKKNPGQEVYSRLFEESMSQIAKSPLLYRSNLAHAVASLLHKCNQNQLAVEMLEKFLPPIHQRTANENNSIAYFRSKTNKGLDTALLEIDAALVKDGSSQAEFLDTKAWVLHGLNRNELALDFVQEAIKKKNTFLGEINGMRAEDRIELKKRLFDTSSKGESDSTAPSNDLMELKKRFSDYSPEDLEAITQGVASLRFHRACILDELGRTEDSELDYTWLDRFGFHETDKLN